MRLTPAAIIVSLLLCLLSWLLMSGLNLNSDRYDREMGALTDFSRLERALNREVLTARAGLSRNYDALARMTDAYDGSLNRLREAASSDSEEAAAIEVLIAHARRQQDLIEQFKSRNAGMAGRGVGETVLVLETDRGRLPRHEEILAALGYEPVGFTRLAEAAVACRAAPARFDAALVCHLRRAASGLDFATALHDLAPHLPIILATPSARDVDAPLLAASGISEVVNHPLTSVELAGALSRCLAASVVSAVAGVKQTRVDRAVMM